jgi:hypothetical protein
MQWQTARRDWLQNLERFPGALEPAELFPELLPIIENE